MAELDEVNNPNYDESNPDFAASGGPSTDDIGKIIDFQKTQQNAQVWQGMTQDPDTAAHAVRLGEMTGVPAPLINNNYDQFVDQEKISAAQGLVAANPDLQAYLRAHPLTAAVSNDDWANLDQFTREARADSGIMGSVLHAAAMSAAPLAGGLYAGAQTGALGAVVGGPVGGFVGALVGGFGGGALVEQAQDFLLGHALPAATYEDLQSTLAQDAEKHPYASFMGSLVPQMVVGKPNLANWAVAHRLFNAALMGGTEAGQEVAGGQGIDPAKIAMAAGVGAASPELNRLGRTVEGAGGKTVSGVLGAFGDQTKAKLDKAAEVLNTAKPWLAAGEDVPVGVHPEIDRAKAEINAEELEKIERDLQNAQATETRERSPEIFAKLTERLYGDRQIRVKSDAALALYGEGEVPAEGDGKLGFVPDAAKQLEIARATGEDVAIPLKDWVAKVDPAVAKGLHDDLLVDASGVTAREAKDIPPKVPEVIQEPLPQVRASGALEPKFAVGDRKISILKAPTEENQFTEQFGGKLDTFHMMDENGQKVGEMEIAPGAEGTLYVHMINGVGGLWANSFGPALIRDLKRQLKVAYPDYEYLTGYRVSRRTEKCE
jgi:hypothetical protein